MMIIGACGSGRAAEVDRRRLPAVTLLQVLYDAVADRFPPADGAVEVLPSPGKTSAVIAFSAHFYVCAPVDPAWVHAQLPKGDFSAPMAAPFLVALAERIGAEIGACDAVLAATAHGRGPMLELVELTDADHPRVHRARRYRDDVRVWRTPDGRGHLMMGQGVAGRTEASFEVDIIARGRGIGRSLAASALGLLPAGAPVFAQVTPGNTASLRATLAAGYRPIGAEVLLPPPPAAP